ncbi:MAG: type II toxin-antitoxin system Phd/YefM family antitoxin [Bdellovibrionales bacterium]|nr:type II toxin-antitoxin system Phd/YefM family antitoxin [Bdellovibrionales bacterium]
MRKFSAKEAKDHFGELIDTAQKEPVEIQKKGRPVAVIVSLDEFKRLEALEETYWANEAKKAMNEGMLGQKESENFLANLLNSK